MQVLYIAGAGRSGSTLLEMILGNEPHCFSVGEVRFFWEYWQEEGRRCGCGELLRACDFWTAVVKRLQAQNVDLATLSQMAQMYDRTRYFPWYILPVRHGRSQPPPLFLEGTRLLYEAVWQESGQKIIIDSSKVPSHLFILSQLAQIDVYALHLVRDGRAVAYSWNKRQKQELGVTRQNGYMARHSSLRALVTWLVENIFTNSNHNKVKAYTIMRYEDLAQDFATVLPEAWQQLGISDWEVDVTREDTITVQPTHSVGGNPLRFKERTLRISLDEAWRREMSTRQQLILGLIAWPVMRQFGYAIR